MLLVCYRLSMRCVNESTIECSPSILLLFGPCGFGVIIVVLSCCGVLLWYDRQSCDAGLGDRVSAVGSRQGAAGPCRVAAGIPGPHARVQDPDSEGGASARHVAKHSGQPHLSHSRRLSLLCFAACCQYCWMMLCMISCRPGVCITSCAMF